MAEFKPDEKLSELTWMAKELLEQSELGITRSDYVFTMVNVLCELHPEIYQKPEVKKLMKKLKEYNDNHQATKASQ